MTGTYFSSNNSIVVSSLEVTQPAANKDFVQAGTIVPLKSITFILDICGQTAYAPGATVSVTRLSVTSMLCDLVKCDLVQG